MLTLNDLIFYHLENLILKFIGKLKMNLELITH